MPTFAVATLLLLGANLLQAQTTAPVLLPNTISTVAGSSTGSAGNTGFVAGNACSPGSPFTATDVYGDGCPATTAVFGPDFQDGVHVDGQGNIWIVDYNENWSGAETALLRKVDAKSGIITLIASTADAACTAATGTTAGAQDSNGDGCIFANAKIQKDRGYGIDPYGNFFTGSYSSGEVRIFCNTVSPLCPVAAGVTQTYSAAQKQVGYSYRIAGCVGGGTSATASASGSTVAGTSGDGYFASSFWNLPGDVTAWGTSNSSFVSSSGTSAGITGTAGTCGTTSAATTGELGGSRSVTADQYGNVYIADGTNTRVRVVVGPPTFTLPNGTTITNPLPAVIALNPTYSSFTAAQTYGRIFPMFGGFSATTKNANCPAGAVGGTTDEALDTYGDACPWFNSTVSSANPLGLTIDTTTEGGVTAPNVILADSTNNNLRVLYMGPTVAVGSVTAAAYPMAYAILQNNIPTAALTQITKGYVYLLAGNGSTTPSTTTGAPVLGSGAAVSGFQRVAAGPNGNIFLSSYSGSNTTIDFYDLSTGYIRTLLKSSSTTSTANNPQIGGSAITSYSCSTPGAGDGTAALSTSSTYAAATLSNSICFNGNGTGSSTLGISVDTYNNLYIADDEIDTTGYGRSRVRKVLASQLYPTTLGSPLTQTVRIHGAAGTTASATAIGASTFNGSSSEINVGTPVCATTADGGNTVDCLSTVTFTPASPGIRDTVLSLSDSSLSSAANYPFFGNAIGSALVADPTALATATTTNIVTSATTPAPVGAAVDSNGDVFTMDTFAAQFTEITGGSTITRLAGTLPTSPTQLSLDPAGNVWAAGAGASNSALTKLTLGTGGTYTASTVSITGATEPQAVTFDQAGNLYVADLATTSVYRVGAATISGSTIPSVTGALQSYIPTATIATGLTSPTSLAIDGFGNVYIGDPGAGAIFRVDAKTSAKTTFKSSIHPAAVAADAAGNVYYQDSTTLNVTEIPLTGPTSVTVLSSLTTPSGLAVAGSGNIYSADTGSHSLTQVSRNALTYNFGTTTGTSVAATLTNVGNLAATGYTQSDSTEFPITSGTPNGCGTVPSTSNALAVGAACNVTSTFTPVTTGGASTSSTTKLLTLASTTGSLILQGNEPAGVTPTATTAITGTTNTAPYAPSGTEITYNINVTASDGSTVTGYVNVTIDSHAAVQYNLTAGTTATVSVPISGLTAGSHAIYAIYPSGQADLQSTTVSQGFTITQVTPVTAWTPGTSSVQYGAPISTSALNATATNNSVAVPGTFVYSANGTEVNAASYLAIGSYPLTATFYPTDSVDFTSATASGGTFTVSKANTSAPLGATQNLVAADGTGNYTSIQTAIQTLSPTTGGSIYIKPGTYTGFVTVVSPFVSIYGLGGNPSNVILTNEDGAFSSPFLSGQGAGNNGNQGDAGSATMLVERGSISGYNGGATTTPYGFYAEGLSLINTYDTDTTTTTTNALVSGVCTAGQPAQTLAALYNSGTECNSQALAFWITADQAVLNNIYTASNQDTIYAGAISGSSGYAARQYWFRGKITGGVDYIFGDAAAVFDHTSIYTIYHGSVTGGETIEAQNKSHQTNGTGDYLSGYIMNSDVFTAQSPGMTNLFFGRPYGTYSTYIMLNSHVDQVNSLGYEEFTGDTNLPTSTYAEYKDITYTDPATNAADLNGVTYLGSGGSSGSGVTGTREITSTNPGTTEVASGGVQTNFPTYANTTLTPAEAQQYYPIAFLSTTVGVNPYNNNVTVWNPTTAIANGVNAFVPSGSSASVASDSSVTILMRPQTPGLGAVANGTYTIPTGTYTLTDTFNGNSSTLATGTLDASGSAYYTTSALSAGTHSLSWTYSGDSNFSGSTTSSAYTLTITGTTTTSVLTPSISPATYGQTEVITATVTPPSSSPTPTGNYTLVIDGTTTMTAALSSGVATFNITGLQAGTHTFTSNSFGGATLSVVVNKATLNVTGSCSNRAFDTPNVCTAATVTNYQYTDTASTVFTGTPTITTTAVQNSPSGVYAATPTNVTLTSFGNTNYTVNAPSVNFNITGNAPQSIIFPALPNFPHGGTYQLTARTTSGLPVTYTVTAGSATISGSSLTVNAAGLITVQASTATDPTGDYATATPVSQSFTAP